MLDWSWMFSAAALALAVAALVDRRRLARRVTRLRDRHEALGDEIWEVRDAVEARQRAEAASEAKSRFLATVSHEVRTPLNGILGIAELLADTPLDREQLAYVEAVRTSGAALATLIDEILDFSRIEAGKLDLAAEGFDLAALVEGVVELLAPRAQDKGLEIAASFSADLPATVVGDPVRLRQVLTNLAGNAVKFTVAGGVGVRVEALPDGRIRFGVADTGPGVRLDRREAIFEEFEQADGTTTRQHGGTGLGLAISRRIVTLMGGELTLADRIGGGSVFGFCVALPAEAGARPGTRPDLRGQTVLIAAASPFQAPSLAAQLDAYGANVVVADRVDRALTWLRGSNVPSVLFVDCALARPRPGAWRRPPDGPGSADPSCCSRPSNAGPSGRSWWRATRAGWSSPSGPPRWRAASPVRRRCPPPPARPPRPGPAAGASASSWPRTTRSTPWWR